MLDVAAYVQCNYSFSVFSIVWLFSFFHYKQIIACAELSSKNIGNLLCDIIEKYFDLIFKILNLNKFKENFKEILTNI